MPDICANCECILGESCGYPEWLCCDRCGHLGDALAASASIPSGILISATRYALGRSTYVVKDTVDVLVRQAPLLSAGVKGIICRDIEHALDIGRGMEMDAREWRRALAVLRGGQAAVSTPAAEPDDWRTTNPAHARYCDGSCDTGAISCPAQCPPTPTEENP